MKTLLILLTIFMLTSACQNAPILEDAKANNSRTDALIDSLKDSKRVDQGRVISESTFEWLNAELNQCKADRSTKARSIESYQLQIQAHEKEFQACVEQLNEQSKLAGMGEFIWTLLYLSAGGLVVLALLCVFLIVKNLSLKRLITGG